MSRIEAGQMYYQAFLGKVEQVTVIRIGYGREVWIEDALGVKRRAILSSLHETKDSLARAQVSLIQGKINILLAERAEWEAFL